MSELLDMIKTRRSIRKYKSDMVPKEIIDKIVEAGTYAATGMGQQSPIILAVTNKEVRDKLSKWNADIMGTDTDPFYGAPVVLVGIGSCWIHREKEEFESEEGKELLKSLGIKGDYVGIGHCVLGYVDGEYPEIPERKPNWVYNID